MFFQIAGANGKSRGKGNRCLIPCSGKLLLALKTRVLYALHTKQINISFPFTTVIFFLCSGVE